MRRAPAASLRVAFAAFAAFAPCLACEPPGPAEYAPEPGLAHAVCEAECARSVRCEGPLQRERAHSAPACGCEAAGGREVLRADWAQAEIACLGRTACDAPDDCANKAYRAIGASPLAWPPVVMRCLQHGAVCGGSSETCRRLAALSDDARAEVSPCFDLGCDDSAACLQSFVATRVAPGMPEWRR